MAELSVRISADTIGGLCGGHAVTLDAQVWTPRLGIAGAKAFEKSKGCVSFFKDAGIYASGFIIDGNQIRGKLPIARSIHARMKVRL
jgi:hypothetical protein